MTLLRIAVAIAAALQIATNTAEIPAHQVDQRVIFSADFEEGLVEPMYVGNATCSIDSSTGANGTKKSVKCTCAYTAKGTTACSGGGGQAEISYTYAGDPAEVGENWESYWIKTAKRTAVAAHVGPSSQIKVSLTRIANRQNGWQLEALGFAQNSKPGVLSIYKCDNGCPNVSSAVNVADGSWHRVVKKKSYDTRHRGCVSVWIDDMKRPVIDHFCSSLLGSSVGNYTFRLGITYAAYSGSEDGEYSVWIDEVRSAKYDIR